MDETLLRDFVYPLLRRSICLYMHLLEEGPDGRLHLPPTVSPEYGSFKQLKTPDAHYDLSLLRWGCETLLYAAKRMGIEDPLQARWADILARLTPLPVDETGYKIGRDLSLEFGHRHSVICWLYSRCILPEILRRNGSSPFVPSDIG